MIRRCWVTRLVLLCKNSSKRSSGVEATATVPREKSLLMGSCSHGTQGCLRSFSRCVWTHRFRRPAHTVRPDAPYLLEKQLSAGAGQSIMILGGPENDATLAGCFARARVAVMR